MRALICGTPGVVRRWGDEMFARMPAWPVASRNVRVVYVNVSLLNSLLNSSLSDKAARSLIEQQVLLTLNPAEALAGSAPIDLWVDRQCDPMNLSLNGNLGSGRVAYFGTCFNVKGIGKTCLANSSDPVHSNGNLDLVSALWEMLCANALGDNLETGSAPVLAVVDRLQPMRVPWRSEPVPSGFIVRLDRDGQLDRPTHLFQTRIPFARERLLEFADALGRQDAEKFIERVLHGCWSAGNVSLHGHLIDYDTVFAVRGRAPQWSYRPNWISNFFGREGQGQKRLLRTLCAHAVNAEHVTFRDSGRAFDQGRKRQLERRFLDLVGYPSAHLPGDRYAALQPALSKPRAPI